jgi:hypothetical protein
MAAEQVDAYRKIIHELILNAIRRFNNGCVIS